MQLYPESIWKSGNFAEQFESLHLKTYSTVRVQPPMMVREHMVSQHISIDDWQSNPTSLNMKFFNRCTLVKQNPWTGVREHIEATTQPLHSGHKLAVKEMLAWKRDDTIYISIDAMHTSTSHIPLMLGSRLRSTISYSIEIDTRNHISSFFSRSH